VAAGVRQRSRWVPPQASMPWLVWLQNSSAVSDVSATRDEDLGPRLASAPPARSAGSGGASSLTEATGGSLGQPC
jgi:hypothetical protein